MSKKQLETQWKNNQITEIDEKISREISDNYNKLKKTKFKLYIILGLVNKLQTKELKGLYGSKELEYTLKKSIQILTSTQTVIFDNKNHNENCEKLRKAYGRKKYIKKSWFPYIEKCENELDELRCELKKTESEKDDINKSKCQQIYKNTMTRINSLQHNIIPSLEKEIKSYDVVKDELENLNKKILEYKSFTKEEMSGDDQNIWRKIPKETDTDYPMINDDGIEVMINDEGKEVKIDDPDATDDDVPPAICADVSMTYDSSSYSTDDEDLSATEEQRSGDDVHSRRKKKKCAATRVPSDSPFYDRRETHQHTADDDPYATDDEVIGNNNDDNNQSKKRKRKAVDSSKGINCRMAEDLIYRKGPNPKNLKRIPFKSDALSSQRIDTDPEEEWTC